MNEKNVFSAEDLNAYTVVYSVTAKTAIVDGYAEIILGLLLMSGVMLRYTMTKVSDAPNGMTTIHIKTICAAPPLGNLGLSDIPEDMTFTGT